MSAFPAPVERVRLDAKARLEQKEERRSDAAKVWVEMAESRSAEAAKTDRLRALRLAKEEADRVTAAIAAATPKPKRVSRKKSAASLGRNDGLTAGTQN